MVRVINSARSDGSAGPELPNSKCGFYKGRRSLQPPRRWRIMKSSGPGVSCWSLHYCPPTQSMVAGMTQVARGIPLGTSRQNCDVSRCGCRFDGVATFLNWLFCILPQRPHNLTCYTSLLKARKVPEWPPMRVYFAMLSVRLVSLHTDGLLCSTTTVVTTPTHELTQLDRCA